MFKLDSMRSRYMLGALFLSVLFLASVWLTHVFISGAVSDTAVSAAHRNEFVESHRIIREHLWKAEYAMQTYLVTPEQGEYEQVVSNLSEAATHVNEVRLNQWTHSIGIDQIFIELSADLNKLKSNVNQRCVALGSASVPGNWIVQLDRKIAIGSGTVSAGNQDLNTCIKKH